MSRKDCIPEENAQRVQIGKLLQIGSISSMDDNQNQFKETIAEYMRYMVNKLELRLEWLCW